MPDTHPLRTLESVVLIAIGGFSGANCRYFVATLVPGPVGTLAVNVLGSFVLGFVLYEAIYTGILAERTQLVLTTGFLSSLTTYSTFGVQTVLLDAPLLMVGNVVATYVLGFAGVFAGRALARRVETGQRGASA
ncbi:fluoride efflux transporter CrcB [Halococcus hamelinensis]|uniref:Fluoride-specific ion channel FluC n=1 Tax=Halococcus hamelinensis 100A6 TaxID=1132509 RepID=M0LXI2_9EURY|nr:fluoride efflux transporter CrcB [Halococcus hamelinensis]EMA38156.1 hypothetical protein C447_10525 [Halococcus hamelinensis 100A6]